MSLPNSLEMSRASRKERSTYSAWASGPFHGPAPLGTAGCPHRRRPRARAARCRPRWRCRCDGPGSCPWAGPERGGDSFLRCHGASSGESVPATSRTARRRVASPMSPSIFRRPCSERGEGVELARGEGLPVPGGEADGGVGRGGGAGEDAAGSVQHDEVPGAAVVSRQVELEEGRDSRPCAASGRKRCCNSAK